MVAITATTAALVKPQWADKVPSPAYDSMSAADRRSIRLQNPWSFLNVTLSPEDLPDNQRKDSNELIAQAMHALNRIQQAQVYETATECLYVYRLQRDDHVQTAIVADIDLADYQSGVVRIHEQVKADRAELLGRHLTELGVTSSPIALTYRRDEKSAALVAAITHQPPTLVINANFGVTQTVWQITDSTVIRQFQTVLAARPAYIIDGHHRAAASVTAQSIRSTSQSDRFFAALFPHDELRLLGFNLWVQAGHVQPAQTIDQLQNLCNAKQIDQYSPPSKGELILYLNQQWLQVNLKKTTNTDAAELFPQLLRPLFSIDRTNHPAIENIAGNLPYQTLSDRVDQQGGCAIYVAPMTIDSFLTIADSDDLLPPKSTYFTPKVQSGVFLRAVF